MYLVVSWLETTYNHFHTCPTNPFFSPAFCHRSNKAALLYRYSLFYKGELMFQLEVGPTSTFCSVQGVSPLATPESRVNDPAIRLLNNPPIVISSSSSNFMHLCLCLHSPVSGLSLHLSAFPDLIVSSRSIAVVWVSPRFCRPSSACLPVCLSDAAACACRMSFWLPPRLWSSRVSGSFLTPTTGCSSFTCLLPLLIHSFLSSASPSISKGPRGAWW